MEGKVKIRCPACKSEKVIIDGNVFRCKDCSYTNISYKAPNLTMKHNILHKDNLKKLDKEMLNNFYNEVLSIWIKTSNKCREEFSPDKKTLEILSEKFEENLKLFFEMLEEKIE